MDPLLRPRGHPHNGHPRDKASARARRLPYNGLEDAPMGRERRALRTSLGRARAAPRGEARARSDLSERAGPSSLGLRHGLRLSPQAPRLKHRREDRPSPRTISHQTASRLTRDSPLDDPRRARGGMGTRSVMKSSVTCELGDVRARLHPFSSRGPHLHDMRSRR